MKKCVVLKKYRDMQMDNKLFKKGDIVSYEEDRANKLAVLGYLKIVKDTEVNDLEVQEETADIEESNKNKKSVKSADSDKDDKDTESDKENEDADSNKGDEDLDPNEDDENTDSNKDDEDVNSKDIEMASMPKKSKKKM